MLDLSSHTVFELQAEVQSLKRTIISLKGRIRVLEAKHRWPTVAERPQVKTIVQLVSEVSHQPMSAIVSEQRQNVVLRPRQLACWLARRFTRHSLSEIAHTLNRDHTTAIHAVRRIDEVIQAIGRCPVEDTPEAWARLLLRVDPWPR